MAWEMPLFTVTFQAGEDLSSSAVQYKFVKLDTSGRVVVCTGATDKPVGILQDYANSSAVGSSVLVMMAGISKMQGDADLAIGDFIGTSSDGQAAAYVPGTGTTNYIVGRVLQDNSAAAGLATVAFSCLNIARGA